MGILLNQRAPSRDLARIVTRDEFNALFPDAAFEDFEEARVPDASWMDMENVLDASTDNNIFQPGEIVDGLRIRVGPHIDRNLFVAARWFKNFVSDTISYQVAWTDPPQMTIELLGGADQAIALDVTGTPDGVSVWVDFMCGTEWLGSYDVIGVGTGTFIGIVSESNPITSVRLSTRDDIVHWLGIDNVAFVSICRPDINGDGSVNSQYFALFLNLFVAGDPGADFNADGAVDSLDFVDFLNAFVAGC